MREGQCSIGDDVMAMVVLLIDSGTDLNMKVCEYSNPLIVASFLQAEPLVKYFLDSGANPNVTCKYMHR
jgi:ankyrin repeat protein